jgi:hypothetical protein
MIPDISIYLFFEKRVFHSHEFFWSYEVRAKSLGKLTSGPFGAKFLCTLKAFSAFVDVPKSTVA